MTLKIDGTYKTRVLFWTKTGSYHLTKTLDGQGFTEQVGPLSITAKVMGTSTLVTASLLGLLPITLASVDLKSRTARPFKAEMDRGNQTTGTILVAD